MSAKKITEIMPKNAVEQMFKNFPSTLKTHFKITSNFFNTIFYNKSSLHTFNIQNYLIKLL